MKRKAGLRIALLAGLTATALLTSGPVGMTATCLALLAGLSALGTAMEVVACRWFCRLLIYRDLLAPDPDAAVIAGRAAEDS